MGRRNREYEEDDGRTIADMSMVSHPCVLPDSDSPKAKRADRPEPKSSRPWENAPFTAKERVMLILGALKASLLIGLAYLLGFAVIIGLMLLFWR